MAKLAALLFLLIHSLQSITHATRTTSTQTTSVKGPDPQPPQQQQNRDGQQQMPGTEDESSDEFGNFDYTDIDQTPQRQKIEINIMDSHLQFTAVSSKELPTQYPIGTVLEIITTSELSKILVLENRYQNEFHIPFEPVSPHSNSNYEVQLSHIGEFCFFQLGSHRLSLRENYCFQVLPKSVLSMPNRFIYIPDAFRLSLPALKQQIMTNIFGEYPQTQTRDNPQPGLPAQPQQPPLRTPKAEVSFREPVKDDMKLPMVPQAVQPPQQTNPKAGRPQGVPPLEPVKNEQRQEPLSPKAPPQTVRSRETVRKDMAASMEGNQASEDQTQGSQSSTEPLSPKAPPQMVRSRETVRKDMAASMDSTQASDQDQTEGSLSSTEAQPSADSTQSRRRLGSTQHEPTTIGINVAFETQGILVLETVSNKMLFLVQHIVGKLMPFFSKNDLIITLPVAQRLKFYERATVSERVALIVNNARKKRPGLQSAFELQYETYEERTFGGRIVLGSSNAQTPEVPIQKLQFVDYLISIAELPDKNGMYGISVKHSSNDHICVAVIAQMGYDYLYNIASEISKCILTKMGIKNINSLHIYISNDGSTINTKTESQKQTHISIEFELELENSECCFVQLSEKSMFHRIYKNDRADKQRQIDILKAHTMTVVPSKALLESQSIHIYDIVFYMDMIDELEISEDLSSHSRIHTLHNLLYSSKQSVSIPKGLWYLCVSWTQTMDHINNGKEVKSTKCADDLYFNANFLRNSAEITLMNGDMSADTSGFLSLQLAHLQSLLQQISSIKDEMNGQNQKERVALHDLRLYQRASASMQQHLTRMENMYQNQMNTKGNNFVERLDLEHQLKIIKKRLQNDQAFESQFDGTLRQFQQTDRTDPLQKQKELTAAIANSGQQTVRLRSSQRQLREMQNSLQQQIESMQIVD